MRSFQILSLALLASAIGCAADSGPVVGDDELSGETGDGEAAKADGIDTFGIYTATKVGAFECNGAGSCTHVELARANRTTTKCADGSTAETCEVRTLDFSGLHLSATKLDELTTKLQKSANDPEQGAQLLIRGEYVHGTNPVQPAVADWVTFKVTQVWEAQFGNGNNDGVFVMASDNGRRCITAPCESTNEARLNSTRTLAIDGLDWSQEVQPDAYVAKANAAMVKQDGLIIVGYRTHDEVSGKQTTLRDINQMYLLVK
ncbi:MAG TPA: DUF6748 domain-containing protein [Kofleriaceae bacterium]|jgi:hypothetical protein